MGKLPNESGKFFPPDKIKMSVGRARKTMEKQ
jgi:hypothetical protein